MYIPNNDKNDLIDRITSNSATAVTMIAEMSDGEASRPDTFAAGYLQGYVHGADMACHIIAHCGEV